jgi:hypothetical protein
MDCEANSQANLVEEIVAPPRRPPGRPKGVPNRVTREIRSAALKKGPGMFRALCKLAVESKDEKVRLAAMKEVLERAYGKSVAPTELTGKDGEPLHPPITDFELARHVCFALAKGVKDGEAATPAPSPPAPVAPAEPTAEAEPTPESTPPAAVNDENIVWLDERGNAHPANADRFPALQGTDHGPGFRASLPGPRPTPTVITRRPR